MNVIIIGAGGHAKVIVDILLSGRKTTVGFLDDNPALSNQIILHLPVLGFISDHIKFTDRNLFIMGIGSNVIRQTLVEKMSHVMWTEAIHSSAYVAHGVEIGIGSVIMAKSVINPCSYVGKHVIINTSASIDHDCVVEDFAHIAPGVNIAGNVHIGKRVFVGIGAKIINGTEANPLTIADDVIIGAGAVVTKSITEPGITVVGIPAKPLKR
ncbi:MAG: acetyltransferase [Phototrophicaceae bacterium]